MKPHKIIFSVVRLIPVIGITCGVVQAQDSAILPGRDVLPGTNIVADTVDIPTNSTSSPDSIIAPESTSTQTIQNLESSSPVSGDDSSASGQEPGQVTGFDKLKLLNSKIWSEAKVWELPTEQLARKMGLSPESKTKYMSSYRTYQPVGLEIAGIKPYMASVYGSPDHPTEINLVFMNQGDFFRYIPATNDKEKQLARMESDFKEQMASQEKILLETLTASLGSPKQSSLGVGTLKERVSRWDKDDQAIHLCIQPDRYIALRILPLSVADARGISRQNISDNELKNRLKSNISKQPNGDVVIGNIPVIDPGPKGYGVPATYERILRYLGMSVDLYTLANSGKTTREGWTYTDNMNLAIEDLLNRSGRKIQRGIPMEFKEIKKSIDRGIPLIWCMLINEEIENQSKLFTAERTSQNQKTWVSTMKKYRLPTGFRPDNRAGNVRMIIGYNPLTEEICYTDSWRSHAKESWMPFDAAKAVSQNYEPLQAITW